MRAEVSCLFHLHPEYPNMIEEAHIGSDVYLQELDYSWLEELRKNSLLKAHETLNWGPYNYRFYVSVDGVTRNEDPLIERAQQLIFRAIVLSRIVQPTPIARGGPWITRFPESGDPYNSLSIGLGSYSSAYIAKPDSELAITQNDATRMAELWQPLQRLFDNEEKYRRILRALIFLDGGYHLWDAEFRHIVFHAALAALICTSRDSMKAQFAQRLPRLVPEINERQALSIHNLYEDIKYAATPVELKTTKIEDRDQGNQERPDDAALVADNQERLNAVEWLEKALRSLLERAISDQGFADLLSDRGEFALQYPVEIKKSSIGDFIIRDKGVRGGRPTIDRTGITVHRIAGWYKLGLRPEEIAGRIGHLSLAQVYAALAHYHANRDEIDAEIVAEEAEADQLEQEHYLSLQSRS